MFEEFKVQRFKGSKVQRFKVSKVQSFSVSALHRFSTSTALSVTSYRSLSGSDSNQNEAQSYKVTVSQCFKIEAYELLISVKYRDLFLIF